MVNVRLQNSHEQRYFKWNEAQIHLAGLDFNGELIYPIYKTLCYFLHYTQSRRVSSSDRGVAD
jgi:hypothetical protein